MHLRTSRCRWRTSLVALASMLTACAPEATIMLHRSPGGTAMSQSEWDASHGEMRALIDVASRDLGCDPTKVVVGRSGAEWSVDGCAQHGVYAEKQDSVENGHVHGAPVRIVTHSFERVSSAPSATGASSAGR